MKKLRGFKLRIKLVRIWRRASRTRSIKEFLHLAPTTPPPTWLLQLHRIKAATLTTKLRQWGLCLARRLGGVGGDRTEREEVALQLPKGHLAVYVGGGRNGEEGAPPRRFAVPVIHCNHPLFGELLREAEEEFGFNHPGGIIIPCPVSRFECVRSRIAAEPGWTGLRVNRS